MNFELSREQAMVKDAIRDWVTRECPRDLVAKMDEAGEFPSNLLRKLDKLEFSGMTVPEAYGGEGRNIPGACLVIEQIANLYPTLARCFGAKTILGGALIDALGSDSQKATYLPQCAKGKLLVAFAHGEKSNTNQPLKLSENRMGAASYVLNGEKHYVSNADQAQLLLVSACVEDDASNQGEKNAFLLMDPHVAGITIEPMAKIGYKGAQSCRVHFDHVTLDKNTLLGGESAGLNTSLGQQIMDYFLLSVSAEAVGLAQGVFDYTLKHARQRVQFGQAIGKFAAIRRRFAEMACQIDAARLLLYRACWLADCGKSFHREVSMAKFAAGETACRCAMDGLQIYGGYGYTMEYDIQRYMRDAVCLSPIDTEQSAIATRIGNGLGL
jgi:alkylation response protein AidB-like acyl-CoA dehydrogenase